MELTVTNRIPEKMEALADGMTPELARSALEAANYSGGIIAEVVLEVFPNGTSALARSFLPARLLVQDGRVVGAGALSDLPYAGIQDQGGQIAARTVRHLAIPLNREASLRWPRDWPQGDLFVWKSKTGNLFLARRPGHASLTRKPHTTSLIADKRNLRRNTSRRSSRRGPPLELMYLLRESVTIRGKVYIKTSHARARDGVVEIVRTGLVSLIEEATA